MAVLSSCNIDGCTTSFCLTKVEEHLGPSLREGELDGSYTMSMMSIAVMSVP